MSLQIHQNLNTLHQYSKNYIGFQSNNASITNCVFLHIKRFKFSNLPIFTIVFLFLLTLCLQDHLIHRFCPFHMSEHLWVKGPFLSLLQDSGTPSHQTPVTRYLFLQSAQNSKPIFSKLAFPPCGSKGIVIGEGEELEGGDGKEGSESECWKGKNHVV